MQKSEISQNGWKWVGQQKGERIDMKKSETAKMEIGRAGAQFVASPKGPNKGKQPKKQMGNDLRSTK